MSELRAVEIGTINQALLTGQVINSLTRESVSRLLEVSVSVRYPGETEFSPFAGNLRIISAGYFSASGVPAQVLPTSLAPADIAEFRFDISAPGFESVQTDISISGADITPANTSIELAGHTLEAMLVNAPLISQVFELTPLPVGLDGLLVEDNDPSSPVSGANIKITLPVVGATVISDLQGRFRIETLPVAKAVEIEVDLAGDITLVEHLIDYATPLNKRVISLNV